MQDNKDTDYAGKTNPIPAIKMPGQRYRAIRKLGAGSMGEVYLAEDTKLHRRVAIKSIRADRTAAGQILRRIKRECLLHARIGAHPHIVTLFDLHDDGDRLFLVMEYVDGDTLDHVLAAHRKEGRPFPIGDSVDIAIQCLRGLAHVHARGIIHRDIKPANVMLTRDSDGNYTAKIMDFGVARQEEQDPDVTTLTHPGSRSPGTPLYMAPEQIDSATYGPVVPASDLYAVGVLLYQMITGQPPFTGSLTDVFNGHLNVDPKPMRRPNGTEPHPLLAEAIDRALLKHAHLRFASAAEFAAELESIRFLVTSGQRSDDSASDSMFATSWHASLTRWVFAGLAGLLIAAAGVVGFRELPAVRLAWESLGLDGLVNSPAAPSGTPAPTTTNLPEVHSGETMDGSIGKTSKPARIPARPAPLKDTSTPAIKAAPETAPATPPAPAPATVTRTPEIIPPKPKSTPEIVPPTPGPVPVTAVTPAEAIPQKPELTPQSLPPVPAPDAAVTPAPTPAPVLDDAVTGGELFNVTPDSGPAVTPAPTPADTPPAPADGAKVHLEAADVPMVMEAADVVSLGEPQVHPIDEEVGLEPVAVTTPAPSKPESGPAEPAKAREAGSRTYRVLQGDTLDSIAKQFGISVDDLTRWNQLRSANDIRPEQVLYLYERPGLSSPPAFDLEGADTGRKESKPKEIIRKTKGMIKDLID